MRHRWEHGKETRFEVTEGRFKIFGTGWPELYRIPPHIDPEHFRVIAADVPVDIEFLLTDLAPHLEERLIVEVYDDDKRLACWWISPDSPTVRSWKRPKRPCSLLPNLCETSTVRIGKEGPVPATTLVLVDYAGGAPVMLSTLGDRESTTLVLDQKDALRIGLALVQAATHAINRVQLDRDVEELAFLTDRSQQNEEG